MTPPPEIPIKNRFNEQVKAAGPIEGRRLIKHAIKIVSEEGAHPDKSVSLKELVTQLEDAPALEADVIKTEITTSANAVNFMLSGNSDREGFFRQDLPVTPTAQKLLKLSEDLGANEGDTNPPPYEQAHGIVASGLGGQAFELLKLADENGPTPKNPTARLVAPDDPRGTEFKLGWRKRVEPLLDRLTGQEIYYLAAAHKFLTSELGIEKRYEYPGGDTEFFKSVKRAFMVEVAHLSVN